MAKPLSTISDSVSGDCVHRIDFARRGFLAGDLSRVLVKLPFLTVAAVVTDNTGTNRLVWTKMQREHPKVFFHGCVSHTLYLVVKDFVHRLP
ncbi:hypothetical protein PHMEG_0005280 [Phytophthora megakarya]|uniref:DUF659 domain-containing protein n=1 Tax=Phytophthora megakarya TaxID=4795 RepID=A0A225WTT6_9STRA|nr:hypothetical protein PHMEG_0005280 [Phytophthora megakarya]